jgi:hypothetical protein
MRKVPGNSPETIKGKTDHFNYIQTKGQDKSAIKRQVTN